MKERCNGTLAYKALYCYPFLGARHINLISTPHRISSSVSAIYIEFPAPSALLLVEASRESPMSAPWTPYNQPRRLFAKPWFQTYILAPNFGKPAGKTSPGIPTTASPLVDTYAHKVITIHRLLIFLLSPQLRIRPPSGLYVAVSHLEDLRMQTSQGKREQYG